MKNDMENCGLCPRRCGVNRRAGQRGRCGIGREIRVARAALHFWEEPCLSGEAGSGTVFFSGCPLGCVYCQNREIANGRRGRDITPERLTEIFFELKEKGALNINLVTPTHVIESIAPAIEAAKARGIGLPFVYNTGGYDLVPSLQRLDGLIDIYLPDMKYVSAELSARYSGAPDYFEAASAALAEMVRQTGAPLFASDGRMLRGTIVRHLMLPGCEEDSRAVLRYLYETYGNRIYISLMNQYTPMPGIEERFPELGRKITPEEYDAAVEYAWELGIRQAYVQEEGTASESFIPDFGCEGV